MGTVTLKVLTYKGVGPGKAVAMAFDLRGGTIGRAESNKLILPDPTVSRVHAQIVNRQGTFIIISRGRNPLMVDEVVVEAGDELPLSNGTRVQIGEFLLEASIAKPPAEEGAASKAPQGPGQGVGESFGGL